ncbi:MAG: putative peptidoglycan D,D-transpeptidase PenA [Verrucomicrobiae bacterium]|nr:putative peptidoglycan D,D-transpeptidase PenA [Verrucomicrobiae bacterium]
MSGWTHKQRALAVVLCLSLSFTALAGRLVDLQVFRRTELAGVAESNREQVVRRQGRRGEIRDCNNNLLANSQSVRIVAADPSITASNAPAIAQKLAPFLKLDLAVLQAKLTGSGKYVRLKTKVDEDTIAQIKALNIRGLVFEDQLLRTYPNGPLASHVLGFVDNEHRGVQGIESVLEQYLQGLAGYEVIERDRKGREIRALRAEGIGPRDGFHVVLTIDQVIQHIAETELDKAMAEFHPSAGVIIVTRPKTGEILAMSSRPTFDPNQPGNAPADSRRNRCVSDVAEPGSTFKIVVASGALNEGTIRLDDRFDCENGAWLYGGRILHDAHPYSVLSVSEILYKSSNIGAAKIAIQRLGAAKLYQYIRNFGFGRKTGIALPGEVSGIAHPLTRWTPLSISRIPMGHEIAATPLQMIMAVNAMANGGRLFKPQIIKSIVDENNVPLLTYPPQQIAQPITPRASILMAAALRKVPAADGTAPKAAVKGYDAAGKTGTAQKIENGQYVRKYYSSFIGYLPAADPEISILVSLDNPTSGSYYGGTVAGPVFRGVAEKVTQYLAIPPQFAEPEEKKVAQL